MNTVQMRVVREPTILTPNQSRVLLRPFEHGNARRVAGIAARVAELGEDEAVRLLDEISIEFAARHGQVRRTTGGLDNFSETRQMVIGSYFLAEYSLESAALFNPSMIPHPDQTGLPDGALRFILSLRATGEGHISSITFRTGVVHPCHSVEVFPSAGFLNEPRQIQNPAAEPESSNYEVQFEPELEFSQRILFPASPAQRNGIEDARFVQFRNDDGSYHYYSTFTAYDGRVVRPELLDTADFLRFRYFTLTGTAARNKGMALFPRKIGGRFAMLSRQDNENVDLMFSDSVHCWSESVPLLKPAYPWELVQIGNCGSPIETEAGWLVLSHGVGPMRKYCIGAFLLDRDNPSRVIGRLREPLLEPSQREREGYVPNVVYSCGGLLHGDRLIIPYGIADHATGFATVPLSDVLSGMEPAE